MKLHYFIFITIISLALPGCATQSVKEAPGEKLKPGDASIVGSVILYPGASFPVATYPPGVKPPRLIRGLGPHYPSDSIGGYVTVEFIVDPNGRVASAMAIQSPDPALSAAVVDAVSQWKFVPSEMNGEKVNIRTWQMLYYPGVSGVSQETSAFVR